jgi:HPt (histidine-containing phosphotransfer) domain-containing protein
VTPQIFDARQITTLLDGDAEAIVALVDLIQADLPRQVDTLLNQARHDDWAGVARTAHAVRGSVDNVGAAALSEIASSIEQAARSSHIAAARALCAPFEHAAFTLLASLDRWVGSLQVG